MVSANSLHSRSRRRGSFVRGARRGVAAEGVAAEDVGAEDMVIRDMAADDSSEGGIAVNGSTNKLMKVNYRQSDTMDNRKCSERDPWY